MKLSMVLIVASASTGSMAFTQVAPPRLRPAAISSPLILTNQVTDVTDQWVTKTEEVVGKVDNLVLNRAMRVVDHAPILVTLKAMAEKAGSSRWGIDMAPKVAAGLNTAVSIPAWTSHIWSLMAICQIASVAKSALAEGSNELSQRDITTVAISNFMATRLIGGSGCALQATALTALVSGYGARQGQANADGSATIHNAALQLMSSFTTVLTVLGSVSWVTDRIGLLNGRSEIVQTLALGAYYLVARRDGNSTVKKAVNAGIICGVLWSRLATSGIAFSTSSLLSVSLLGTGAVAYVAANKLVNALK